MRANILIINHDKTICDTIATIVSEMGQNPFCAFTLGEGIKKALSEPFDIIFIHVRMPDGSGLDVMSKIKAAGHAPEIIITGYGDPDEAEAAITNGAWDYIEKPTCIETITRPLIRALEYRADRGKGKPVSALKRKDIIGSSQRLYSSFELLLQAAQSDANVLITGETGTGKELFARAIHSNSHRAGKEFVIVDCTALPETLVESVLFGHARGAFTGAYTSREGLIKQADKGTLFLDEIGELPLSIQKSFLRVIQERRFRPVGGNQEVTSDFRLLAATNRDLEAMVRDGQFREDLLFRIRTFVIELPPLRDCLEDIEELVAYYMKKLCDRFNIPTKELAPEFRDILTHYKWPGNVRELVQTLERSILSAKDDPILFPKHLPTHIRVHVARNGVQEKNGSREKPELPNSGLPGPSNVPPKLKAFREAAVAEAEQQYIKELIAFVHGNIDQACKISGLSRSRLYTLLKKHRQTPTR
ncbi:MAG: sigma-54-dependent transcriptional regulator [Candidatus Omnitrophota bacterium]